MKGERWKYKEKNDRIKRYAVRERLKRRKMKQRKM
jgi:hypothetical protein